MLRWLIDKKIRLELDDLFSENRKLKSRVDILEATFKGLKGRMYRVSAIGKSRKEDVDEAERAADPLAHLSKEEREFLESTAEYQQMQRIKTSGTVENEW